MKPFFPGQAMAQIIESKVIRRRQRIYLMLGIAMFSFMSGIVYAAVFHGKDIFLGTFI